jgi:SAM-dependent methyltransferase
VTGSRWAADDGVRRGADYDATWAALAEAGQSIHGEADLVARFDPAVVLDAGCGTGRVAIELAGRGVDVVGVDLDPLMIARAREKAPHLDWVESDLCEVRLGREFDVVVAAGNVMIFLRPGSERAAVGNLARHLRPGGVLVAGFELHGPYGVDSYDADCRAAGLALEARYATWDGEPFGGGGYAVSVHRR